MGAWSRDPALNNATRFSGDDGARAFLDELKSQFDVVAVTDHMKCGLATRLSQITSGQTDDFCILPGMEVNFQPEAAFGSLRIHLLVIMPEGTTTEKFGRLFYGLEGIGDDAFRKGNEEVKGITLKEWVKRVHDEGGLCLAAHVDGQQGARSRFRQTSRDVLCLISKDEMDQEEKEKAVSADLKDFLLSAGFDGIEVSRRQDKPHYRWVSVVSGEERSIPVTLTFDAHCIEDMRKTDRTTWVKMTKPSFGGLRDALKFAETRIRFAGDVPDTPSPGILGIEIIGTNGKSFFETLQVGFAENLNCLIGPRGSGKSTLVEALRYVFGYNRTLNELDSVSKLSRTILDLQRANLAESLIRVVYRTRGKDIRILEATYDPKADCTTKVFNESGDPINVPDVEASDEYPLRLFGWSEIETLGREAGRQRDLLDRLVPEVFPLLRERVELRRTLAENRKEIEKLVTELNNIQSKNNGEIRRYTEFKSDFERLNTKQVQGLFSSLDLSRGKKRVLEKVLERANVLREGLGGPDKLVLRDGLDAVLSASDKALREWWLGEEMARLGVITVETTLQGLVHQARENLESFCQLVTERVGAIDEEIASVEKDLRTGFAADASMQKIADLRVNAETRLRRVEGFRVEYLDAWERLQSHLTIRRQLSERLVSIQNQITGIRARCNKDIEQTLNRFLSSEMKVSILFVAGGDKTIFCEKVGTVLSAFGKYKVRKLPDLIAARFNPVTFVQQFLEDKVLALGGMAASIGGEQVELTMAEAARLCDQWAPFGSDEHAQVSVVLESGKRLFALLALEEVEWDDHEAILLNDRPVNELSPGQRSSAMLPLIALSETTPLVIDQPEDNLDNRLIGRVLVNILAELKEKRQIIVCTHNPNIVVSGDAEQVVVMEAVSDRQGRVSQHGSIDNEDIVKTVIEIMEGGKEAFMARSRRYGF